MQGTGIGRALLIGAALGVPLALPVAAPAHFFTDEAIESIAPVVILHGDERYHPTSGEEFIDHAGLAWNHNGGCDPEYHRKRFRQGVETPWKEGEVRALGNGGFAQRLRAPRDNGPQSCAFLDGDENVFDTTRRTRPYDGHRSSRLGSAEGWYLDLSNTDRAGLPDRVPADGWYETAAPTYFDDGLLYRDGSPTGFAFVTFWFFSSYNDGFGPQNHEGDWENISIRLESAGTKVWRPVRVYYAKHGNKPFLFLDIPDLVSWEEAFNLILPRGPTLALYSAEGSHASYGKGVPPIGYLDRIDVNGLRWGTWKHLRFLWDQNWAGYCGAWGRVGRFSDTTGPLGPGCLESGHPVKTGRPSAWGNSSPRRAGGFDNAISLGE